MDADWRILLSCKDRAQLQEALDAGRELALTRTMADLTVTARTVRASPVWGQAMLLRVERRRRNVYTAQYYRSVEEMMQ